jgi:uncharacterized protein (TIGR02271 family)
MRSVIALYEDQNMSRSAMNDLVEHGFEKERIRVLSDGHDTGRTEETLKRNLDARNIPRDDAELYVESVRRGCALVLVDTSDEKANEASSILDRHTPMDLDSLGGEMHGGETQETREAGTGHVDVVEEEVKIGKRPVHRGGVRVHTHVTERPVDEDIELREERVHVERHAADETLSPAEAERAFKDETIEVQTTGEEAVVAKEARVVERVDIGKEAGTRTEHVRATERRQDVEVEAIGEDDEESRRDWETNYKSKGVDYDTYRRAYGLGHRSGGGDPKSKWSAAEPKLQREWEERHHEHGPWDKFRAAIRRGWDKAQR